MNRRSDTKRLALCGVLAALALALMFLGGVLPFTSVACPVLASLVLIPVYAETGKKWSAVWFLGVAALAALLAPDKETAVLFAFFGYYPMLRKYLNRLRPKALQLGGEGRFLHRRGARRLCADALRVPSGGAARGIRAV